MKDDSMLLTCIVAWSWLAITTSFGISFVFFFGDAPTVGFDSAVSCAKVVRAVATLGGASRLYTFWAFAH